MKCQKCEQETFLPFRCPYCGGYFCSDHRLPENHECPQIELARTPVTVQKQKPYEYTVTHAPFEPRRRRIYFSSREVRHLTIAALLVAAIALSVGFYSDIYERIGGPIMLAVFTLILTGSFFTHEIAHKITAQRRALWAEFRLTFMGAILTLLSVVSPFFKIISPGAVVVSGFADMEKMGKISIMGPATNIALSTIFLAIAFLLPQGALVFFFGAAFNAWIALFNLIPFGILDGFKVFMWDKKIWALAFAASLILTIGSYGFVF